MPEQEEFSLHDMIGFYVNRTAFLMSEGIAKYFEQKGYPISAQDFGILNLLWKKDGLNPGLIAEHMLRDKTTISRRIDSLVQKGLLSRQTDPTNRRQIQIYLTEKAWTARPILIETLKAFHAELLDTIPPTDIEITVKTLNQIIQKRLETDI